MQSWFHPSVVVMLFLGISAGTPILLIFGTLSIWLTEAGVAKSSVTFFSWAALGYSFKFIWAPLVDKLPFPYLSRRLGRRRSWMLISQFSIIGAITWMAMINPAESANSLSLMAFAAVLLGFSSATQDIVIDAYRIECREDSYQALLAASYIAGYRIGMVIAGAGALFLADALGTNGSSYLYGAWKTTYLTMAGVMLIGVATTLIISEPERVGVRTTYSYSNRQYFKLFLVFLICCLCFCLFFFFSSPYIGGIKTSLSTLFWGDTHISGFIVETSRLLLGLLLAFFIGVQIVTTGFVEKEVVQETYIDPLKEFFVRYGLKTALLILLLVGFYRVSDIVLGVIANVFYVDMGFSKTVIGSIAKTYGLAMTIIGGFLGGILTLRYGVYAILFLGAVLSAVTNLLFMVLAGNGPDVWMLILVIAVDNLSAGLAASAFVAFLSSLTSVSFTAVQYALFSSLMTLFPKLLGGYSGTMVENLGYSTFFMLTTLMGIPVLFLIWLVRRMELQEKKS